MKYANKILTAGVIVMILPFLGLPPFWKTVLLVLAGLWVCLLSYPVRFMVIRGRKASAPRRTPPPQPEQRAEPSEPTDLPDTRFSNTNE
ncbi:MAG: hypothetical protein NUV54_02280 [Candidatus Taylorbacteria bacterium]|nr:hypothetical protein [Candidatus Taylorbacteria bacterium]